MNEQTTVAIVALFAKNVAAATSILASGEDAATRESWKQFRLGQETMTLPRIAEPRT